MLRRTLRGRLARKVPHVAGDAAEEQHAMADADDPGRSIRRIHSPVSDRLKGSRSAQQILEAARELFSSNDYDDVSIRQVAEAAGVSDVTVYRTFDSKAGLAAACWLDHLWALDNAVYDDQVALIAPLDVVTNHVKRLADVAAGDRRLTNAMVVAVHGATIRHGDTIEEHDPRTVLPLSHLLEGPVAAAQTAGMLRRDIDAHEIAAMLNDSMLLRTMTWPSEDPGTASARILDVLLPGLMQHPED